MQIGDKVIVHYQPVPYTADTLYDGKIISETKTSWRVEYNISKNGESLYSKTDLFRKIDMKLKGGGDFSCTRISEFNQEEWCAHNRMTQIKILAKKLCEFPWHKLNLETLTKIHAEAERTKTSLTA